MPEIRLLEIDETNIGDHYRLTAADKCYFLFEYTAGMGYSYSSTNNLISNLKKKPSEANKGGYHYKARAIADCSSVLGKTLNEKFLEHGTLVPVPSSKAVGHPDYDDRLVRICRNIRNPPPNVRELVINTKSHDAAHESDHRPTVEELLEAYQINEDLAQQPVTSIGIFDDVLTAGTHFRAMQIILSNRFPGIPIYGIFIARRALPKAADEFDDLDELDF